MNSILKIAIDVLMQNSFVTAFMIIGVVSFLSELIAKVFFRGKVHASAIGIFIGLILAYIGGVVTHGSEGAADMRIFAGLGVLGGSVIRDFVITSTTFGADWSEIKKCGLLGLATLLTGITLSYSTGAVIAYLFGYHDAISIATIAAGSVTFVVGPVTGAAIGAESSAIAISIVAGLVKSVAVMLLTPFVAKPIGLTTPKAAMIYGGLIGSVSGTTAGLTATDSELVPYGAVTASFYTGMGCLLCPSVLYGLTKLAIIAL